MIYHMCSHNRKNMHFHDRAYLWVANHFMCSDPNIVDYISEFITIWHREDWSTLVGSDNGFCATVYLASVWHPSKGSVIRRSKDINHWNKIENSILKAHSGLWGGWVKHARCNRKPIGRLRLLFIGLHADFVLYMAYRIYSNHKST